MVDLGALSYKELQALAKQHGISARQKGVELIAALAPLVGVPTAVTTGADEAAPAEEEPVVSPTKRGRGRPRKVSLEVAPAPVLVEAEEEEEVAPRETRKRSNTQAHLDEAESAEPAPAAAGRKSKKSKAIVPADDEEEAPAVVAQKDRVTKRGRRVKRVTEGEAAAEEIVPAEEPVAPSSPAVAEAEVDEEPDSPSPIRARPSMAPSARKRWSHVPLQIFGIVVQPPAAIAAQPTFGGSDDSNPGSRDGSPQKKRGSSLLGSAQISDFLPQPQASSTSPILSHSSTSSPMALSAAALPLLPLSTSSTGAPLPNARSKASTSSRLSFTRFPPPAPVGPVSPGPVLPPTLFATTSYHPPASFTTGTTSKAPFARTISKGSIRARALAKSAAASSAAAKVALAAAKPPTLAAPPAAAMGGFSTKSRAQRLGLGATSAVPITLPMSSPPRASLAATTAGASSLRAGLAAGVAAHAASTATATGTTDKRKFDLAASLQRPVGWQMKKGALPPVIAAAASIAAAPDVAPLVPGKAAAAKAAATQRTAQLKAPTFASTRSAQMVQAQQRAGASRQARQQQARNRA